MKKSMLILTLMVAALCGCAAQHPTTLETPETSVLVEVTPETGSEAAPTSTPKGTRLAPAAVRSTALSQAFSKSVRLPPLTAASPKIGRASCRERV